jgi:hypothetical protein
MDFFLPLMKRNGQRRLETINRTGQTVAYGNNGQWAHFMEIVDNTKHYSQVVLISRNEATA